MLFVVLQKFYTTSHYYKNLKNKIKKQREEKFKYKIEKRGKLNTLFACLTYPMCPIFSWIVCRTQKKTNNLILLNEKNGQIVNKIWEEMYANCHWHHGRRRHRGRLSRCHCHYRRHWRIQTIHVSYYSENPLCFRNTQSSSSSNSNVTTKRVLHIIRHWSIAAITKIPWDISNESSSYFYRCAHTKSNTKSPITIEMWNIKGRLKKRVPRPNCIVNSNCNINSSYRNCEKRQHLQSSFQQPLCIVDDQQQ